MANSLLCSAKLNALTSAKNVVSLFSGGGGADIGFEAAGLRIAVSQDFDKAAVATLRANTSHPVIQGDISALLADDPSCNFLLKPAGLKPGEVFAVVGGPPCQSFSAAGKRRGVKDERGALWERFAQVVGAVRPRFFVMENVSELAKARSDPDDESSPLLLDVIIAHFAAMGYTTVHGVLDAVNYGAPQFRERLILIGSLYDEAIFLPLPTHHQYHQDPSCRWRTLNDATGDLDGNQGAGYQFTPQMARYMGHVPEGCNGHHLPAELWREAMGETPAPKKSGSTGYFRRLARATPTPTLTTSPSERKTTFCHPTEDRPLSVREYARIQVFPDDWVFEGSLTDQYKQIGNAVPVSLARAIGLALVATATNSAVVKVKRRGKTMSAPASAFVAHTPKLVSPVVVLLKPEKPGAKASSPTLATKNPTPVPTANSNFGATILATRKAAGLSMATLAAQVGLTKGAVRQVEIGRGNLDTLLAVAGQLGLHLAADGLPEGANLGLWLAALRMSLGISKREIARRGEVTGPTLDNIELGKACVHLAGVIEYAELLDVRLSLVKIDKACDDREAIAGRGGALVLPIASEQQFGKSETFSFGEFFCGAGGLSYAAIRLLQGAHQMEHRWSVDANADACRTYRQNICPDSPESVICADIRKLDMSTLPDVDVLLFGFPCNDFSTVGEQKGLDGVFGPLYRYPVDFLRTRQPKCFVAENVSGLASANGGEAMKQILAEMADAGYRVTAHLYKLEEYGIAQSRHRIFLVGVRQDVGLEFRVPAPGGGIVTSRQALTEPPISIDAANHELPIPTPLVAERLSKIPAGANLWSVNDTLPPHLRLNVKGAKISTIYKRLDPGRPAYTLTASGGGGTHMYHWEENRALTNRERARLQSFPDSFAFCGNTGAVRRQIGMAVPPAGALKILQALMDTLAGVEYPSVEPNIGHFRPSCFMQMAA